MTRNIQLITIGVLLTILSGTLTGCSAPARSTMAAEQASPASELSGTIVETMDAAGYTYICIERDGKKTWAATTTTKVTVGQQIKLQNGAEMNNFQSKALNRTFDKIIFSGGVVQEAAAPVQAKAAVNNITQEKTTANMVQKDGLLAGKVVETMNAASYTYLLLEKDGRRSWAAIPAAQLSVGDEVELYPGTEMGNFTSKTLNRSFDSINFSGGLKSVNAKGTSAPTAPTALPTGHPKMDAPTK
ncbi:MAG: hypothetical protein JJE30_14765 [Desulfuromonadales bacterium]|nr:hypothetical protein [Desulfuromonadales bacterium]